MLANLFRTERRAIQATAWGDWGDGTSTYSGTNVTVDNAWQLLTVYGCNRFICDGISTLPVDTFRRLADGTPVNLPNPGILEEPATDLDFIAWSTQFLSSLLLGGDFYGYRDWVDGHVDQVIPLDPMKCTPFRNRGRKMFRIGGAEFSTVDILHVPGIMLPGSEHGLSPVEAARQNIGIGKAAEEFGGRFFDQGATLSGVIEVPGELDPVKTRDMARAWAKKHSGKQKSHLPGVLQGGAVWKPMGVTNEQAQFLETRQFTASQIAGQMFLIDPTEMGLPVEGSSITYANLEQRNARKVQVTFLPWIIRLEKALSSLLPNSSYVKLNVGGLLRGDMKTRFDSYAVGINNGFMLPNEARDFEDWKPLPDEGGGESDEAQARKLSVAEAVQKVYLGVGAVITSDEAREIVNEAGGDLPVPGPQFGPAPTPPAGG